MAGRSECSHRDWRSGPLRSGPLLLGPLLIGHLLCLACNTSVSQEPVASSPEPAGAQDSAPKSDRDAAPKLRSELLKGKVVWLADALARRYGVKLVPEAKQRVLAIETAEGAVVPIAEDIRGRSLRVDKRLRDDANEFLVGRYPGSPVVQIIRIYQVDRGTRRELDYWCEICAIAMFELKACDCCQGPIELRRRESPLPKTDGEPDAR